MFVVKDDDIKSASGENTEGTFEQSIAKMAKGKRRLLKKLNREKQWKKKRGYAS